MFVPGGWWHAVINLDNTIAITENVCNEGNFERVWVQTRKGRKRLAYKWLRLLRQKAQYHNLYKRALEMNVRDMHIMWTPDRILKKDKKKASWSSSSESISSSTSSDSSESSSDDFDTIEQIRGKYDINQINKEINDENA
jgi:histone arginine demethylase JMJD6